MATYLDLGSRHWPISTTSEEAQLWFDRGLTWCYAFHHGEAVTCFEKVVELDPDCAMGYWGLAYATGPYYNITWEKMPPSHLEHVLVATYEHTRNAIARVENGPPLEQALCQAFLARFQAPAIEDPERLSAWDDAYADAMRAVYAKYPEHNEVCALTAEALMTRTPWQLWDLPSGQPVEGTDTLEAIGILEKAMSRMKASGETPHPGLLHFYIHAMEMSPEPEKALEASDTLRPLIPDAGHLIHMPSHIYVLCGRYDDVINANVDAMHADNKYLEINDNLGIFTIYRAHNIHFQIYGAIFTGRYEAAMQAVEEIEKMVTPEAVQHVSPFIMNSIEHFSGLRSHVYVRFGKWQEIIDQPLPDDPVLFPVSTAYWFYAKGIAHAVLGQVEDAQTMQARFAEQLEIVPEERVIFNNEARDILKVAEALLAGELEYRREHYDEAFTHLRRSVDIYDNLHYTEPWVWMQPPRHALGALLLEQGYVTQAADVYRADLGLDQTLIRASQHPDNLWSLHGYAECCDRLGHEAEAAAIKAKLEIAQAVADIPITASCFCRTEGYCCD